MAGVNCPLRLCWFVGWLVGWLEESLYTSNHAGGGLHKDRRRSVLRFGLVMAQASTDPKGL